MEKKDVELANKLYHIIKQFVLDNAVPLGTHKMLDNAKGLLIIAFNPSNDFQSAETQYFIMGYISYDLAHRLISDAHQSLSTYTKPSYGV